MHHPDEELDRILDHACNAVGRAQANEAYAQVVAGNVREIVMLEHLHDEKVSLAAAIRRGDDLPPLYPWAESGQQRADAAVGTTDGL